MCGLSAELLVRNLFLSIVIIGVFRDKESSITKGSDYHAMSACLPPHLDMQPVFCEIHSAAGINVQVPMTINSSSF
jgi:hypothetical protein